MPKGHPLDLRGKRFGFLVAYEHVSKPKGRNSLWRCRCDCGKDHLVEPQRLIKGIIQSCGCQQRALQSQAKLKHGKTFSKEYRIWLGMKNRCKDHDSPDFGRYGARGIRVCERWMDFRNFYADMGDCPPSMTLDRKNNGLGYSKENCRWATGSEQSRNRRSNRLLTYAGKTMPMVAWAEARNMPPERLQQRLARGWDLEEALTLPLGVRPTRAPKPLTQLSLRL